MPSAPGKARRRAQNIRKFLYGPVGWLAMFGFLYFTALHPQYISLMAPYGFLVGDVAVGAAMAKAHSHSGKHTFLAWLWYDLGHLFVLVTTWWGGPHLSKSGDRLIQLWKFNLQNPLKGLLGEQPISAAPVTVPDTIGGVPIVKYLANIPGTWAAILLIVSILVHFVIPLMSGHFGCIFDPKHYLSTGAAAGPPVMEHELGDMTGMDMPVSSNGGRRRRLRLPGRRS